MTVRPAACDRARLWASVSFDGELTELEHRALEAHLTRCTACSEFAGSAAGIVRAIRSAPPQHVVIPPATRARRRLRRLTEVSSAAAAALLVVTGASMLLLTGERSDPSRTSPELISPFFVEPVSPADEARWVREAAYRRDVAQTRTERAEVPGPFLG
jgi:Putative zinc-finger